MYRKSLQKTCNSVGCLQNVYKMLDENTNGINFIGNIEGRDVLFGGADVVVTDGFSGNIMLKTIEGVAMFFSKELKNIFMKNIRKSKQKLT